MFVFPQSSLLMASFSSTETIQNVGADMHNFESSPLMVKVAGTSPPRRPLALSDKVRALLTTEGEYAVGGFAPVPGFIVRGLGSTLYDIDNNKIIDFIAAFSAANLGQCHPRIVQATIDQARELTLTNLAYHTAAWPDFAQMMCRRFGYDKISAMTSGAEAADTACKIARKWATQVKGVAPEDVLVLGISDNYHGLTSGVWPLMNPDVQRVQYATFNSSTTNRNPVTGQPLRYGVVQDMEDCLRSVHGRVAAVIMECIHGRLPTFAEELEFAKQVRRLCKRYNVLFIADEVRMGAAKTGRMLCSDWLGPENKPDMITMGKSISGGAYPASYILGNDETMSLVGPYESASTFAMSPMAIAVTRTALEIIEDERLCDRALQIQTQWQAATASWRYPFVDYVTSRGADLNVTFKKNWPDPRVTPRRVAMLCLHYGLMLFPLSGRLRMSLALTITDGELHAGFAILKQAMDEVTLWEDIPGSTHVADINH